MILFSVMVGATLADFHGIMTAMPIAASIKDLFLSPDSRSMFSPVTATAIGPGAEAPGDYP